MTPAWYSILEPCVQAVQVTPENAREVAEWCGGWATEDLPWSTYMLCYKRPDDGTDLAGALFPGWEPNVPTPGGVMLAYGVVVLPGDWVAHIDDHFTFMRDSEFQSKYQEMNESGDV